MGFEIWALLDRFELGFSRLWRIENQSSIILKNPKKS
jgi:hypothetical protein